MKAPHIPFLAAVKEKTAGNLKVFSKDYLPTGVIPIVDQGQALVGGYTNVLENIYQGELPCIVFGDHTRAFKYIDFPFALGADGVKILRPFGPELTPEFLFWYFKSLQLPSLGYSRHYKLLKSISVPVPPLAEQRQIVDLLTRASGIRRLAEAAEARARALPAALFVDMFGDPATNPKDWPVQPLGSLVQLVSGGTPTRSNPLFWQGSIPWVSAKDMKPQVINTSQELITEIGLKQSATNLIPKGSVLIVVRGMILSHTVPIRVTSAPVTINQDLKAMIPKAQVTGEFIRWMLQVSHSQLIQRVGTAAHGTTKLDTDVLTSWLVPLPPLSLQHSFANHISEIEGIRAQAARASATADALTKSLMADLFTD